MKLFQLLPKKLYDFACNLPGRPMAAPENGETAEQSDVAAPS